MKETVEQVKHRVEQLLQFSVVTNEQIDALNEATWKLRYTNDPLAIQLSAKALQFANRNGYERGRARALHNSGWSHLFIDDFQKAEQSFRESHEIFLRLEDDLGLGSVLNGLAVAKTKVGDHEAALANLFAALPLREKMSDSIGVAAILNNLGIVFDRSGNYALALEHYYRTLETANELRLSTIQAQVYNNLGDALWRVGEAAQSLEYLQQVLDHYQEYPNRFYEGTTLINIGAAYQSCGEYQNALKYYERGLETAQDVRNLEAQVKAQTCLGNFYCETGDWQTALIHLSQALQLSQKANSRFYESETWLWLGLVYKHLGDYQQSLEALMQALQLSKDLNANDTRSKSHLALSQIFEEQNKFAEALRHHQAFHQIWQEMFGSAASRQIGQLLSQREFKGARNQRFNLLNSEQRTNKLASREEPNVALSPRKLQEVTSFIAHHLERNLALADLADLTGLSQNYFLRSFKHSTGKTPHQFVIEQRVARAKELLHTTSLPLTEIALRCGFSSQSHLTTHFRLLTGTTPRQFQRSLRSVLTLNKG